MAELDPGSTKRRWIPDGGLNNHRDKIHRESKFVDDYKNLPFSFSKPQRNKKTVLFKCIECGRYLYAPINTFMCGCPVCKKATKVERIKDE